MSILLKTRLLRRPSGPPRNDTHRFVALIGLGSNLFDRARFLDRAVEQIRQLPQTELLAVSKWHETAPVGGPPQGPFLNGAAKIRTELSPDSLLDHLQRIERSLGRPEQGTRWGPRVIDLDLLAVDQQVIESGRLTLPHPRLAERSFVLIPLTEIAPEWRHPLLKKTTQELLQELSNEDCSKPG